MALPNAYQEVEYLQSVNSSKATYINLGKLPKTGFRFKTTYLQIAQNSTQNNYLFGWNYSGGHNQSFCLPSSTTKAQYGYAQIEQNFDAPRAYNTWYDLEVSNISGNEFVKINNVHRHSATVSYTAAYDMDTLLFCQSVNGNYSTNQWFYGRVKTIEIFNSSGTMIRNLVPCYRKSDLVPGMYDTVNNVFYTNAGTGTFAIGNAIYTGSGSAGKTLIGATAYGIKGGKPLINNTAYKILRGKNMVNGTNYTISFAKLPSELQEVQYLQSDGNQWIEVSNVGRFSTYTYFFDFQYVETRTSNQRLFNIGATGNVGLYNRESQFQHFWATDANKTVIASRDVSRHTISFKKASYIFDGVSKTATVFSSAAADDASASLYLWGSNERGPIKIYSCYVLNSSGTKIFNLVPCYRKSDNVAGMFDLVSHIFYTNKGTGSFTVGPNV